MFLHPPFWGYDPTYFSFVKLTIFDIHHRLLSINTALSRLSHSSSSSSSTSLSTLSSVTSISLSTPASAISETSSTYALFDHPVTRVEIVGTIVSRKEYEQRVIYVVDDATGTITVNEWLSTRRGSNYSSLSSSSSSSTSHSSSFIPKESSCLQLGDVVSIRGKLSWYMGKKELSMLSYSLEPDVHAQLLHYMTVIDLFDRVYRHSAQLPPHVCPSRHSMNGPLHHTSASFKPSLSSSSSSATSPATYGVMELDLDPT